MSQINQKPTRTLPLIGAICASLLIGLPAIAQNTPPDPNKPAANTNPSSPDNSNPGLNTSPANRVNVNPGSSGGSISPTTPPDSNKPAANTNPMSPDNTNPGNNTSPENRVNTNPGSGDMMSPGMNRRMNTDMMSPGMNQQRMNRQRPMSPTTSPSSFDGSSGSAVLNPCPSIFYEAKYAGMGIKPPAGCPAASSSSSDRMMSPDSGSMPMTMPNNRRMTRPGSQ